MTDANGNGRGLSTEVSDAIRKEAVSQVSKWVLVGFVVLFGIAASGWWFYLQQKLDEYIAVKAGGLPVGAVVAFALDDGCPSGWAPYQNALGSTIVGAGQGEGLTKRSYLFQGGNEAHALTIDEMPPHSFKTNGKYANPSGVDRYNAGGSNYPVITAGANLIETETLGKGTVFQTMPPFVVLYYCKKNH